MGMLPDWQEVQDVEDGWSLCCTVGWSEKHFFGVNVLEIVLRYQNTVYEI